MFLTREKNILEMLFTKKGTMTTNEMSVKLNVSTRTVKSDIKRLNTDETLIHNGCSIITKAGVGYWLVYDQQGEKFLKELFDDNAELVSPEMRKYLVAWYILNAGNYVSMEEIANEMFISKSTVLLTVNELAPLFSKYDLQLNKKAKFGVKVEGLEGNIRRATVYVLQKIIGKPTKNVVSRLKDFFEDMDLSAMQLIVRNIETKRKVMFADLSFYEVLLHLAVTVDRVSKGFLCKKEDVIDDLVFAGHELQEAAVIADDIYQEMDIRITSFDLVYIQYNIMCAKIQTPDNSQIVGLQQIRQRNPEFYDYIVEILSDVGNKNGIDFFNDEELLISIILHLEGVRNRAKNKGHLDNPFCENIKNGMVYECEIAIQIIDRFAQRYEVNADDNEVGFVALHVGAVLEREITRKINRKQLVYLVCVAGVGLTQYISAKFARLFPNIEIEQVIPLNRLSLYENKLVGKIVISTVNIEVENAKVVHISPAFSTDDIKNIQKVLEDQNSEVKYNNNYPVVLSMLNKDIAILQCDLKSKEEAIQLLGSRLVSEGYGDDKYISSVFAREEVSDTSIGCMCAIPHAVGNHVLKNGIGLMTLKKPISWGFEKVQIVLMISVDGQTGVNLQKTFAEVLEIINNPGIVNSIIKSQKYSEIVALLGNNQEAKNETRGNGR